jgi:hypothetical protein
MRSQLALSRLDSDGPHRILPGGWEGMVKCKIRLVKLDSGKVLASGVTLYLSFCAVLLFTIFNIHLGHPFYSQVLCVDPNFLSRYPGRYAMAYSYSSSELM